MITQAAVRRAAALAALSCLALIGAGIATGKERRTVAALYLAIARAGNRGLDHSLGLLERRDKTGSDPRGSIYSTP